MLRTVKALAFISISLLLFAACFTEPERPMFNPVISFLDLDGFTIPNIEGTPGDSLEFVVAVEVSEGFQSIAYGLKVDDDSAGIEFFDIGGALGPLIAGGVDYVFVDSLIDREAVFVVEAIDTDGLRSVSTLDIETNNP
ncbi:MAG TPA: hypothetical protein DCE41_02760 [Cytophagales bacterium]|nr:hypothetical protein [Cytophagales bacterium]HAA21221.1 hypothetical protein [Cytophagales bacterium]HAP60628.1 hypothetical protein [Cytophagales bacterium]